MSTYIPAEAESSRRSELTPEKEIQFNYWKQQLNTRRNGNAEDVLKFMVAFDQIPTPKGELVPQADFDLATKLIEEEAKEFYLGFNKFEASQTIENAVEMLDGAADLIYVVLWAMLKFGLPFDSVFAEVQRSNMAKLLPDGTYMKNEHGKVKKPDTWTPPDIFGVMMRHTDNATWKGNMRIHEGD